MTTQNRRILPRRFIFASCSAFIFAFGIFAFNARTLASNLFGAPFFAVAFSILPLLVGIPCALFAGFVIRFVIERAGRQSATSRLIPLMMPAIGGVGFLAVAMLQDRSPEKLFAEFLNVTPPRSLSHFQYWWTTLPGDRLYLLSFEIEPAEFDQLLGRCNFIETSDPREIREALARELPGVLVGQSVQLSADPFTSLYACLDASGRLPRTVKVFATGNRRHVLISGDN